MAIEFITSILARFADTGIIHKLTIFRNDIWTMHRLHFPMQRICSEVKCRRFLHVCLLYTNPRKHNQSVLVVLSPLLLTLFRAIDDFSIIILYAAVLMIAC